ncbi:hypothetical protein SAMN06295879_1353 [Agreia bicolorata]|uniref:Uncharacterized protein n=1 Tax=Agreia bicolorata TaxID=110935 RepID=A0A1T4XMG0_9MICO|nr:hypothetical protein SAMN06295879_1353 [Agreia bicolorata]
MKHRRRPSSKLGVSGILRQHVGRSIVRVESGLRLPLLKQQEAVVVTRYPVQVILDAAALRTNKWGKSLVGFDLAAP